MEKKGIRGKKKVIIYCTGRKEVGSVVHSLRFFKKKLIFDESILEVNVKLKMKIQKNNDSNFTS